MPLEKEIDDVLCNKIKSICQVFYFGMEVKILPLTEISTLGITSRQRSTGLQYKTSKILKYMSKHKPSDGFCMIAALKTDLYPSDSWNYVFGEADLEERVGVFSFARYYDSFFSNNPQKDNMDLVFYRSCKVMVHELGHQFGMDHCTYYSCLMNGANNLEESDRDQLQLCPICLRKLQFMLDFDLEDRMLAIRELCKSIPGQYFVKEFQDYDKLIHDIEERKKKPEGEQLKGHFREIDLSPEELKDTSEESSDESSDSSSENEYECDICKETIASGSRYHCLVEEDFDLCKNCYLKANHPHEMKEIAIN